MKTLKKQNKVFSTFIQREDQSCAPVSIINTLRLCGYNVPYKFYEHIGKQIGYNAQRGTQLGNIYDFLPKLFPKFKILSKLSKRSLTSSLKNDKIVMLSVMVGYNTIPIIDVEQRKRGFYYDEFWHIFLVSKVGRKTKAINLSKTQDTLSNKRICQMLKQSHYFDKMYGVKREYIVLLDKVVNEEFLNKMWKSYKRKENGKKEKR